MFTIQLEKCNVAALEKVANGLINTLQDARKTNTEQAFELWAFIRATSNMLEALVDNQKDLMCELFRQHYPVGEDQQIGEYIFRTIDKPDYNYANNDDDGRYKVLADMIEDHKAEGKSLTKRMNCIKEEIRLNHKNMVPTHHYSLTYSGTKEDGNKKIELPA